MKQNTLQTEDQKNIKYIEQKLIRENQRKFDIFFKENKDKQYEDKIKYQSSFQPNLSKQQSRFSIQKMNEDTQNLSNTQKTSCELNQQLLNSVEQDEQKQCRLCLESDTTEETGQLLNVCNCNGSLKYIHKQCLWLQLDYRINKMDNESDPLYVNCELCKKEYRISFKLQLKTQTYDKFKTNIMNQFRAFIIFLFITIGSILSSVILFRLIPQDQKTNYFILIVYFFFSFAVTTGFISFGFISYYLYDSLFYKTVGMSTIFPDQNSYQNYKQRMLQQSKINQNACQVYSDNNKHST